MEEHHEKYGGFQLAMGVPPIARDGLFFFFFVGKSFHRKWMRTGGYAYFRINLHMIMYGLYIYIIHYHTFTIHTFYVNDCMYDCMFGLNE